MLFASRVDFISHCLFMRRFYLNSTAVKRNKYWILADILLIWSALQSVHNCLKSNPEGFEASVASKAYWRCKKWGAQRAWNFVYLKMFETNQRSRSIFKLKLGASITHCVCRSVHRSVCQYVCWCVNFFGHVRWLNWPMSWKAKILVYISRVPKIYSGPLQFTYC